MIHACTSTWTQGSSNSGGIGWTFLLARPAARELRAMCSIPHISPTSNLKALTRTYLQGFNHLEFTWPCSVVHPFFLRSLRSVTCPSEKNGWAQIFIQHSLSLVSGSYSLPEDIFLAHGKSREVNESYSQWNSCSFKIDQITKDFHDVWPPPSRIPKKKIIGETTWQRTRTKEKFAFFFLLEIRLERN